MKKEQIKKIADQVFKKVPGADKAFITSDGQGFVKKNSAQLHQRTNPKGKKLEVFEVDNPSKVVSIAADTTAKPSGNTIKVTPGKKSTPEDRSADDSQSEEEKAAVEKVEAKKRGQDEAEKRPSTGKAQAETEKEKKTPSEDQNQKPK